MFQPFVAQSRTNMELYESAMLAWEKEMRAEGRPELVRGYKPPKKTVKPPKKTAKPPKKATMKKPSSPQKKSMSTQTDESWMREE